MQVNPTIPAPLSPDELPLCACGCGQAVPRRGARFVQYHHSRLLRRYTPLCACGCGRPVLGRRHKWVDDHYRKALSQNAAAKTEKTCSRCKSLKPRSAYHKATGQADGLTVYCKSCLADKQLQKYYGLSVAERDAIADAQGGRCAICRRTPATGKRLYVDHDHASGKVRGLLCQPCNHAIGLFREDPAIFAAAVAYLQLSPNPMPALVGETGVEPMWKPDPSAGAAGVGAGTEKPGAI